jgi:osmotically-inducible protein OsmY
MLLRDPGVSANNVDIETTDGIVEFTGTVSHLLAKERAERLAETVKGVRAVINKLKVMPVTRSDEALKEDIQQALSSNPVTESQDVDVFVRQGVATLGGAVQSAQEKNLVAKVAASVKGLREVVNNVTVKYPQQRPDQEIAEDVRSALRWDALVQDGLIDVSVTDGTVMLRGSVGSAAEKRRARGLAQVIGVRAVETDQLQVVEAADREALRKEKYAGLSEREITAAAEQVLARDARVPASNIGVEISKGTATLRGSVPTLAAKQIAEELARSTVGVWNVKNQLKIRPVGVTKETPVAENVSEALLRDPFVSHYEVNVAVHDGNVTLRGAVDSLFDKTHIEKIVSDVNGVTGVRNALEVVDEQPVSPWNPYVDERYIYSIPRYIPRQTVVAAKSDWAIQEDIRDELWWSPFVDSDSVDVSVEGGVATLTGKVATWSEREAAMTNALEGGATAVINKLKVDYGPEGL